MVRTIVKLTFLFLAKQLSDNLSDARKKYQHHVAKTQQLKSLNTSMVEMEKKMKHLSEGIENNEREFKVFAKDQVSCRTDLEDKEKTLATALEDVKVLYSNCHESNIEYQNSHKQLEKDASSGVLVKLNKCDADIEKSALEKKDIERAIIKQQPAANNMEQMEFKSASLLKTIVDNIMVKELQVRVDP